MNKIAMCALSTLAMLSAASTESAETTYLYMDSKTKQIFAEPGPGRVKFGQAVVTKDANVGAPVKPRSISVAPAAAPVPSLADMNWADKFQSAATRSYVTQHSQTTLMLPGSIQPTELLRQTKHL